jgi:hypothetical protein
LKKSTVKRVCKSDAQKWEELITELQELAILAQPDEFRVAMCMPKVGALNLVQPFNWRQWPVPFPEAVQCKLMDLETAIKHITRICRAERFMEGVFMGSVKSGVLLGLCLVVREHTRGERAPSVMSKAS